MINERKLTEKELEKREVALKGLLQNKQSLVKKYGKEAEKVMYGIATKQAKSKVEAMNLDKIKETIEGLDIGSKVKIAKEYGGGKGTVEDIKGSFVVVKTKKGNESYHESDLKPVEERIKELIVKSLTKEDNDPSGEYLEGDPDEHVEEGKIKENTTQYEPFVEGETFLRRTEFIDQRRDYQHLLNSQEEYDYLLKFGPLSYESEYLEDGVDEIVEDNKEIRKEEYSLGNDEFNTDLPKINETKSKNGLKENTTKYEPFIKGETFLRRTEFKNNSIDYNVLLDNKEQHDYLITNGVNAFFSKYSNMLDEFDFENEYSEDGDTIYSLGSNLDNPDLPKINENKSKNGLKENTTQYEPFIKGETFVRRSEYIDQRRDFNYYLQNEEEYNFLKENGISAFINKYTPGEDGFDFEDEYSQDRDTIYSLGNDYDDPLLPQIKEDKSKNGLKENTTQYEPFVEGGTFLRRSELFDGRYDSAYDIESQEEYNYLLDNGVSAYLNKYPKKGLGSGFEPENFDVYKSNETTEYSIGNDMEDYDLTPIQEDLDIGHEDNEPKMLKAELARAGQMIQMLYKAIDKYDGQGEVDFPQWWQKKIIQANTMLDSAFDYIDGKERVAQIDAVIDMVGEVTTDDEFAASEEAARLEKHPEKDLINKIKDMMSKEKIKEKLTKKSSVDKHIEDFKDSDAPQFKGKSDKKKVQMAVASFLAKQNK